MKVVLIIFVNLYKIMFENTEIGFQSKSNKKLKKSKNLFKLLSKPILVRIGKILLKISNTLRIPTNSIIKNLFFDQFCGGETIEECENCVKELKKYNIGSILDYSVEGNINNAHITKSEIVKTIKEAKKNKNITFCVFKMSALISFQEKKSQNLEIITQICEEAKKNNIKILIDAEESWIQDEIDIITESLMSKYNTQKSTIIFHTIQLYRKDKLNYLKKIHKQAKEKKYKIGLKLVRGAYMEKERFMAQKKGYESPIHNTKKECDNDFNNGLEYCINHIDDIDIFAGTHNENSCIKLTQLMRKYKIHKNDNRINFSQLLGMSDHISFNLAKNGYNVSKYVPFGPIKEMIPYLIRRAEENSSVKGQTSKELDLIKKELQRRKIQV